MNKILRISTALGILAIAAASQALTLNYVGQGVLGSGLTATTGAPDDFNFTSSTTSLDTVTLTNATGSLVITAPGLTSASALYSSLASAVTGTLGYAGYTGVLTTVGVTQLQLNGLTVAVQGTINKPVPEPASMAALAIGGLGLVRLRRRKA